MTKTQLGITIAVCCAAIFGIYPPAVQGAYAAGANASLVLIVTTWTQFAALISFSLFRRQRLFADRKAWRSSLIGGAFQTLSVLGFISALQFIQAPLMIIILFLYPLMILFMMVLRGEATLSRGTVLTAITTLFGLTLVLDVWHIRGGDRFFGALLALLGALATAGRIYVFGKSTSDRNPAVIGAESFAVSSVLIVLVTLLQRPCLPISANGYIYLSLASASLAVANLAMFYGIALLGSFRWGLYLKLEPVFTALFSVLFFHELLKPLQYVGMAVVLASLIGYQLRESRRSATSAVVYES